MINAYKPAGTATGPNWQYRIERDGLFTPWVDWSIELYLDQDPDGSNFRTGVLYYAYAQNLILPAGERGSVGQAFVTSFEVLPSGRVVAGSADAAQEEGTGVSSLLASVTIATVAERRQAFMAMLNAIKDDPDSYAEFCAIVGACGIDTPPPQTAYPPKFVNIRHFDFVLNTVLEPVYRIRLDNNSCGTGGSGGSASGWCLDENHTTLAPFVRITVNGTFLADVICTIDRPDVLAYLKGLNLVPADQTFCRWGWGYDKPNNLNDGTQKTWAFYGGTSSTVATTDVGAPFVLTCGLPGPTTTYRRTGNTSVTEGGIGTQLGLEQLYSDGSWQAVSDLFITWSNVGAPSGVGVDADGFFLANANTVSATTTVEVHAAIGDQVVTFYQQVLNADCQRPGSLPTYALVWNFVPTGGNARLFATMADASNTVGGNLDGSLPGAISSFFVQMGSISVGQSVYLGVGMDCAKADSKIYYVLANGLVNSIKKAITVVDGVITAVQDSAYNPCTNYRQLSQGELNALPTVTIYEYADNNTPNGPLSRTVRPFATREEAISHMSHYDQAGYFAHYDFAHGTTSNLNVGDILYGDDRVEHILAGTSQFYPVEAGYWGFDRQDTTFILLKSNACGQIIGRETITLLAP